MAENLAVVLVLWVGACTCFQILQPYITPLYGRPWWTEDFTPMYVLVGTVLTMALAISLVKGW